MVENKQNEWLPTAIKEERVTQNGEVKFTETGLVFEIPYTKNPDLSDFKKINSVDVLRVIKTLVRGRLWKCTQAVHEKDIAYVIKGEFIVFKDGTHYSGNAAKCMRNILAYEHMGNFKWPDLIQAIKSLINPYALDERNRECVWDESCLKKTSDYLFEILSHQL